MSETISVVKGQKVDLTKSNPGLTKIMVGLGWDPQTSGSLKFDLDASVILLDANGKYKELVYFHHLTSADGAIVHSGDNLTGDGDGDDEKVYVSLPSASADQLVFVVNIFEGATRRQNFGMVKNAFIRVVDASTNAELLKYDLSEDFSVETGVTMARIYKHNGEWKFEATGTGFTGSLQDAIDKYR